MVMVAVEVLAEKGGAEWKEWIGGHYENSFSCNPIWDADYQTLPAHPITRGVKPFKTNDEWYFNMRFREGKAGVKDILVATPSDAVRDGPYVHPKGPYAHIQAAKGKPETMMWAVERAEAQLIGLQRYKWAVLQTAPLQTCCSNPCTQQPRHQLLQPKFK
jgi:hypothetical protein